MNMNALTTLTLTMSSQEIAELTGKRHDNVLVDIRKMLVELHGEEGLLKFQETPTNPQNKQQYLVFKLPKRESLILISGYSITTRAKIIDRWMELEAAVPALDRTKEPRAKMEAKLIKFLEGKPLGVSSTALGRECFPHKTPLPLEEVLDGLLAAGVLAMEEVPRVDGNPGRPTRLWRLSNLTLARLPDPDSKLERCKVFIAELVALGPVAATEALAACEKAGFSGRTIDRARKALALPAYQKQEGGWVWQKPEGEGNTWLTLTPRDLDALVRRAARGMGLTPRKAAPVPVACNPPTEAAALAALALQRMVVGFGPDGRMNAQLLREDEYIMTLDDFAYTQEKFLEQHGLAIVPKCLLDAARAMQAALGD